MLEEVIMAIDINSKSNMGCAYFSTEDGVLYLSEDLGKAGLDDIDKCLAYINPTTVLISLKAPEDLVDFLEQKCHAGDTGTGQLKSGVNAIDGC